MSIVYLSLGSNLGDREKNIDKAVENLSKIGKICQISSFFYSPSWGYVSPNEFCNICVCVETSLNPFELLQATKQIENTLGRVRHTNSTTYEDRIIDIDIIFYDDLQLRTPTLTLPHPKYKERDFVLVPLKEILQREDPYKWLDSIFS